MKKISLIVPCYNDENSVQEMAERVRDIFAKLDGYDYELIFVDDCSPDATWEKISLACEKDKRVKGVHNITNFGPSRNLFSAFQYGDGDAFFMLMGDLQEPPEVLPEFLRYWESGYNAVCGVHMNTDDRGIMALGRKIYYRMMGLLTGRKDNIGGDGHGLYDRKVIESIRQVHNVHPYLPGILSEYGGKIKTIPIEQMPSKRGRSNQNFLKKYDYAMLGLTSYTKILMRISTFAGCLIGVAAVLFSIFTFVMKLTHWNSYPMGIPSILIGVFFLGAVQLFFMGIMGEYILSINERSMDRPLTVADKKINFEEDER